MNRRAVMVEAWTEDDEYDDPAEAEPRLDDHGVCACCDEHFDRVGSVIRMDGNDYLDIAGIAERIGVKPASVQTYHTRAGRNRRAGKTQPWDLPAPDARFGGAPVWLLATIEAWERVRPGTNTNAATEARRKKP